MCAMLKLVRKHPVLWACVVIAIASIMVMTVFGFDSQPAFFAVFPLASACVLALWVLNYVVFSSSGNSTIHRHETDRDNDAR